MIYSICLLALSAYLGYIWEFIFLFINYFEWRKNIIYGDKIDEFVKHVKYASTWDNNKPTSWVIRCRCRSYCRSCPAGANLNADLKDADLKDDDQLLGFWLTLFIGFIVEESESISKHLCVLCSNKFYTNMTKSNTKNINLFSRTGLFWNLKYVDEVLNINKVTKNELFSDQENVITQILTNYKKNSYCTVLLYGPPKTGKTMTVFHLALLIKHLQLIL